MQIVGANHPRYRREDANAWCTISHRIRYQCKHNCKIKGSISWCVQKTQQNAIFIFTIHKKQNHKASPVAKRDQSTAILFFNVLNKVASDNSLNNYIRCETIFSSTIGLKPKNIRSFYLKDILIICTLNFNLKHEENQMFNKNRVVTLKWKLMN